MHPFTLERPRDVAAAIALGAEPGGPVADYIAGGTDMLQLLQEEIRRPERLVALGAGVLDDRIEIGPTVRSGSARLSGMSEVAEHAGVRDELPADRPGTARRRLPSGPQHGDDRRQPPAADTLRLLPRHRRHGLQQAPSRYRAARRWKARTACTRSWAGPRCIAVARLRPGRRAGRARRGAPPAAAEGDGRAARGVSPPARRHAARGDRAGRRARSSPRSRCRPPRRWPGIRTT